jgi:hypothetical protein
MASRWKRLVGEPLVQFLALGALLFLYFAWRGGGPSSQRIVVTPGRIAHLSAGFERTWQRPPTEEELKGLLDDFVREEIASREAMAMGLDAEDTIIRRRLRQKLEFLVEDAAVEAPPTDAELQAFLDAHAETFRVEPRVSFRQVYVSRDRRGEEADSDALRLLDQLRRLGPAAAIDQLGDPLMVPQEVERATQSEVARLFGDQFAAAVVGLAPGAWSGPVESGYGPHLVLVEERMESGAPGLDDVRPEVERDFLASRRKEQLDATYARLLEKYTVVIERPQKGAGV